MAVAGALRPPPPLLQRQREEPGLPGARRLRTPRRHGGSARAAAKGPSSTFQPTSRQPSTACLGEQEAGLRRPPPSPGHPGGACSQPRCLLAETRERGGRLGTDGRPPSEMLVERAGTRLEEGAQLFLGAAVPRFVLGGFLPQESSSGGGQESRVAGRAQGRAQAGAHCSRHVLPARPDLPTLLLGPDAPQPPHGPDPGQDQQVFRASPLDAV